MNEDIEQAKERLKRIIDFYKLNDENNYDYSDEVLISMRLVLEEIERLEKRNKEIYEGFMATQEELKEYAEENERLNNIINEVREYIELELWNYFDERNIYLKVRDSFLEILDKGE